MMAREDRVPEEEEAETKEERVVGARVVANLTRLLSPRRLEQSPPTSPSTR